MAQGGVLVPDAAEAPVGCNIAVLAERLSRSLAKSYVDGQTVGQLKALMPNAVYVSVSLTVEKGVLVASSSLLNEGFTKLSLLAAGQSAAGLTTFGLPAAAPSVFSRPLQAADQASGPELSDLEDLWRRTDCDIVLLHSIPRTGSTEEGNIAVAPSIGSISVGYQNGTEQVVSGQECTDATLAELAATLGLYLAQHCQRLILDVQTYFVNPLKASSRALTEGKRRRQHGNAKPRDDDCNDAEDRYGGNGDSSGAAPVLTADDNAASSIEAQDWGPGGPDSGLRARKQANHHSTLAAGDASTSNQAHSTKTSEDGGSKQSQVVRMAPLLLHFDDARMERKFTAWHAQQMYTRDVWANVLAILFESVIIFHPIMSKPYRATHRAVWTPLSHFITLATMLLNSAWFLKYRDIMVFCVELINTLHCTLSYVPALAAVLPPEQLAETGWFVRLIYGEALLLMPVFLLVRFRRALVHQLLFGLVALATAVPHICGLLAAAPPYQPLAGCLGKAAATLCLVSVPPLAIVYCLERRSRSLFAKAQGLRLA